MTRSSTEHAAPVDPGTVRPVGGPELSRLPREFVRTLTPEQRALLRQSLAGQSWGRHPVDLRLTVPFFHRGLFVTVIAGTEKRNPVRRREDRRRHPLHSLGNVAFLLAVAALLYALVVTGAVLADGVPLGAG